MGGAGAGALSSSPASAVDRGSQQPLTQPARIHPAQLHCTQLRPTQIHHDVQALCAVLLQDLSAWREAARRRRMGALGGCRGGATWPGTASSR